MDNPIYILKKLKDNYSPGEEKHKMIQHTNFSALINKQTSVFNILMVVVGLDRISLGI
jgi:hypothetical protein